MNALEAISLLRRENKHFMIMEITGQLVSFVTFIFMGIYNEIMIRFASLISSCYIIFSFGYWFLLDWVFSAKDLAVHKKKFAHVKKPEHFVREKRKGVGIVLAIWLFGALVIWFFSYLGLYNWYVVLMLESVLFALNSLFIRKKCWLSTYIMKNKNNCCKNCTINSWDYAFFVTPLIFAPNVGRLFQIVCGVLIIIGFACFVLWEILYYKYPWRFYSDSNEGLNCSHCRKKCDLVYKNFNQMLLPPSTDSQNIAKE